MYEQQFHNYFESIKPQFIKELSALIELKSCKEPALPGMPYGRDLAKVLNFALDKADEMGFLTKNYDNYVGAVDMNHLPTVLDILAHLDVVPAGNGWSITNPYTPKLLEGKLYGRGTADDKGPAFAALFAMKAIKDLNFPLKKNVRLIFGTDEECGSSDIAYYYTIEKPAPMTFSPDGSFPVTNVEKGGLHSSFTASFNACENKPRILSMQGGSKSNMVPDEAFAIIEGIDQISLSKSAESFMKKTSLSLSILDEAPYNKIICHGKGCHAASPERGENAVTGLISFLTQLDFYPSEGFKKLIHISKLFPHGDWKGITAGIAMSDDLSGELTISLNMFSYTINSFIGNFDCRAPLCATNENLKKILEDRLIQCNCSLSNKDMYPGHYVPENSSFVKTLLKCYEQYTGNNGYCMSTGGGTYVHNIPNGVAFGCGMPGMEYNMHGANEFTVIDDLLTSAKIFAQVIIDLCQ